MPDIDTLLQEILRREGGFVNDPDDPGGATNFGITIHTLRRLGIDVDGDGEIDTADIRGLDATRAASILRTHYFTRPKIDRLPEALQPSVFDMYVNAGAQAVRLLQTLLGDFGVPCTVDGVIGAKTAAAAALAMTRARAHLVDAYGIARRNYYYALADRRPASRKYARRRDGGKGGWILRAEEFIAQAYHFSEAQHRARVASWG